MTVAIVTALADEMRPIIKMGHVESRLRYKDAEITLCRMGGKQVVALTTGVGADRTREGLEWMLAQFQPEWIVGTGYAGGAAPDPHVGDAIVATRIVDTASGQAWTPSAAMIEKALSIWKSTPIRFHHGTLAGVAKPAATPHEKAFIGTTYEALAIDMESHALADVATRHAIPFLVVRVIFDPMAAPLPLLPDDAIADGRIHLIPLLRHLIRHPKTIGRLPHLAYSANTCQKTISTFIQRWLLPDLFE